VSPATCRKRGDMKYYRLYRKLKKMLERGVVKYNYNLKKFNTYNIKSRGKVVVLVNSLETFLKVMKVCEKEKFSPIVIGRGSNIILARKKIKSVIIIFSDRFSNVYKIDNSIIAESGAALSKVVAFATNSSLSGMESAVGIPASVGGAVYMNASAFDYRTSDVVKSVLVYSHGKIREIGKEELGFGYRQSIFQTSNDIILRVEFELAFAKKKDIRDKIAKVIDKRKSKNITSFPNAGSVFKNGNNYFAGELIDNCGLKNYNINDAYVSYTHANFIENRGRAKGKDILALIDKIKQDVKTKYGVELQLEQKIIGE